VCFLKQAVAGEFQELRRAIFEAFFSGLYSMSNTALAIQFFLQIAVILSACRVVGIIAARFGQPQVVAEMIAGVCLGPSLLGLFFPELQHALFPWDKTTRDTQSYLFPASQLGLALYMFIVGMEFRIDIVRAQWKSAIAVSVSGMLFPFALGLLLGWYFFRHTHLFPPGTDLLESGMFLGASMCITAFPMLARIIHHRRLTGTRIGTVAIGAGALDDASAWCLLAFVLASVEKNPAGAFANIGGGAVFVIVAAFMIRPLLRKLERRMIVDGALTDAGFVSCIILMSLSAYYTDLIGLHAVFGAFVIGTVIPRGTMTRDAIAKIHPLTVAVLLPLFFTFSGLNTRIGLLNSGSHWGFCLLVLATAVAGKGIACWLAARVTGIPNREAVGIGVLMNARGMMELIIINIGRERGLISDELFAMLVVMAIVTTLMTSPIFDRLVTSEAEMNEPDAVSPPAASV
jgi:Kef-type K+ transport system membrane component KefB